LRFFATITEKHYTKLNVTLLTSTFLLDILSWIIGCQWCSMEIWSSIGMDKPHKATSKPFSFLFSICSMQRVPSVIPCLNHYTMPIIWTCALIWTPCICII